MTTPLYPKPEEFVDLEGNLSAPGFPTSRPLVPPFLRLEEHRLLWSWLHPDDANVMWRWGNLEGMLDVFVRIRDAKGVLRFAERYGVLEICIHGLPVGHVQERDSTLFPPFCDPWGLEEEFQWVPLERWFHYTRKTRALLDVAAALIRGRPAPMQAWQAGIEENDIKRWAKNGKLETVEGGREIICYEIWQWVRDGDVRPTLTWRRDDVEPSFVLSGHTFGLLGVQLMLAVARAHNLAMCSGCGIPYYRKRKPQAGRRNFCQSCGQTVANRVRQRAWRMSSQIRRR